MAGSWLISEGENWRSFGRSWNKTGRNNLLAPRMNTNRHEYSRHGFHKCSQILLGGIQPVLIHEIGACAANDSWSFETPSMKVSDTKRPFSSSPRDAGVGRGSRRGGSLLNIPPRPGPLLHPMEERELLRLLLCRGKSLRGFAPHISDGNC